MSPWADFGLSVIGDTVHGPPSFPGKSGKFMVEQNSKLEGKNKSFFFLTPSQPQVTFKGE